MIRWQLARYSLVGVLNTALHLLVVFSLSEKLGLSQTLSNMAAYLVASAFSYSMNALWSFRKSLQLGSFFRFQVVGLLGLVISGSVGYLGDIYGWHYAFTVLVIAGVVPLASFILHRLYTFS